SPAPTYYTNYPATGGATATLVQGTSYPVTVTFDASSIGSIFIDYNQNGIYEASEWVQTGTTGAAHSATITVPITALTGLTGMRVRSRGAGNINGSGDACLAMGGGETENYLITIAALVPCAGQPDPVTITGPTAVCPGINFTLTASGASIGSGITYQWEMFDGINWVAAGSTTPTYTVTGGITTPTDYRFVTTCSNGGGQDVTGTYSIGVNSPTQCYCNPTYVTGGTGDIVTNVVLGTLSNNSTALSNPPLHYTDYTSQQPATIAIPDMEQGLSYPLTLNFGADGTQYHGVWIDFDQSGTFDASEFFTGTPNPAGGSGTATVNILVPITALPGNTRMRIRGGDDAAVTAVQACGASSSNYGEAEDYLVNITPTVACTGTPAVAAATGPANACDGVPFNLVATGATTGAGISYDWQYFDGTNWVSTGGTTASYSTTISAPTDFRFVTTCANGGGQDISNTVSIGINPPTQCYCIPVTTSTTYYINNFSTTGGFANINNANSGLSAGGYGNFTATQIVETMPTGVFNFAGNFGTGTFGVKVWADWNQDGDFSDADEQLFATTGYVSSFNGSVTVPVTALSGTTRLRVGANWLNGTGPAHACESFQYGEYEDYGILIGAAPSCLPPATLYANNTTMTTVDVSWDVVAAASGYEWAVDQTSAATPTGTVTQTTSNTPPTVTGLNAGSTYYLHVRADCGSGNFSPWMVLAFNTQIANDFCSGAIAVPVTGTINGNNAMATDDALPAVTCGSTATTTGTYHGMWYTATAASSGSMTVATCGAPFDTYIRVYTGTCGAFTGCAGFNDDGCGSASTITFAATANTTYYILVGTYGSGSSPNNGAFTLTVTGVPLSIKMDHISATNAGSRNRVDWKTVSEDNGDYFEVERSANGVDFGRIGTVAAKGAASAYSYWDNSPVSGNNYYRLKLMSPSGTYSYSDVVIAKVNNTNGFSVEVFPNPVSDLLHVSVSGAVSANATVALTDVTGKVISMMNVKDNAAVFNMNGMAAGLYLVRFTDGERTTSVKVNKQ
ncbi:MAG: T9SS type A sorting domain-containing protein, partial [Sphingobacteriales bacterium]